MKPNLLDRSARLCLAGISALLISPAFAGEALDERLQDLMRDRHVAAAAVAIVRQGQVAVARAYGMGNVELDVPVTPSSPFQIASATKPFVGTLTMMLVEEGKLALDAPVGRYLSALPAEWRPVRVRQLATHSSGLPDAVKLPSQPRTREELIGTLSTLPFEYAPGTRYAYNVTDSVVLQAAIEKVTGQTLPEALRTRIFEPLGMRNTGFSEAASDGPVRHSELLHGRVSVYRWEDGRRRNADYFYPSYTFGAGGLYSSIEDLGRFYAALFSGRLLSEAARAEMWRLKEGVKSGFGLNWVIDQLEGQVMVGHAGGPALGDVACLPAKGLCAIVLTNEKSLMPGFAGELLKREAVPGPGRTTDADSGR